MKSSEGFTGFTADQWQIFFTVYATVSLWKYLPNVNRKILTNFVRICSILVRRIVQFNLMVKAHQKLIEIIVLIEQIYSWDFITLNFYLSLHLYKYAKDFRSLYIPIRNLYTKMIHFVYILYMFLWILYYNSIYFIRNYFLWFFLKKLIDTESIKM